MTEITIKLIEGGICERMRNVGYRFVGTGAGRIYFKTKNGSATLYLEFKTWSEVDEFCKQQEQAEADIEEVIADMREARG